MRIVVNALSARLGGGQTYIKNLLANLPDAYPIEILLYAPKNLEVAEDKRIRRLTTHWPTDNPILRTAWEKIAFPFILMRLKADILFCPGGVVATKAPRGYATVTMFRNMIPFDPKVTDRIPAGLQKIRNFLLKRVMLRSMTNADLTIFISEYARKLIEDRIKTKNSVTIPHGISSYFRTFDTDLPRPSDFPRGDYILYVSRFDVYKHHYEVVRGYAALPESLRASYRLILIGEAEGPEADRVIRWIDDHKLQDRIIIKGAVPYSDLPAVYRHATATLFASSCENCPNILLEALGAGRPVLSSSVMPMPEFGGDAVRYFSPTEPSTITAALREVLQNSELGAELGAKAGERSKSYDWPATAAATWNTLRKLVDDQKHVRQSSIRTPS